MKMDCMLDLETWGKRPGCVIRSIGAVMFDPYDPPGTVGTQFYTNVERADQEKLGLVVDPDTEKWWAGPKNAGANELLSADQKPIRQVVDEFVEFWRDSGAKRVWGQGGNYDDPVLTAVFDRLGLETPWKFFDARCTRTAYAMGRINVFNIKRLGVAHHALHDAIHQVKCVQTAHANIREK